MTTRTKIVLVAGARPNFMKVAPIIRELRKHEDVFDWRLVHTGQHYDHGMSDVFFQELGIPEPNFHMGQAADHMRSKPLASWWPSRNTARSRNQIW